MRKFNILVVDDDTTCLLLLKSHLEKWNYEVTTVDDPLEALYMLRIRSYDMVISDVHMPGINGIKLLEQIVQDFHLPVIMISADGNAEVMCMMKGAQLFLEKPIEASDLEQVWQIIVWWKAHQDKNTAVITENKESSQGGVEDRRKGHDNNINADGNNINSENVLSSAAISTTSDVTKGSMKKNLVWTTELHSSFAEALVVIGYENAVPKNILEFMDVSGITLDHVASHLQKYRKFVQQVLDGKTHIQCSKWIDITYNSSIVPGNPDVLLLNRLSEKRIKGVLAANNPLGVLPEQHNIDTNVQFRNGSSASGQYRPLPPYTSAASGGLDSATFPCGYNENIESSSMSNYVPNMGEMGYYDDQNTLVQELNNYTNVEGLFGGGINDMIPCANNVAPSGSAPIPNNSDAQQSINMGGQGSSNVYYANNVNTTDQLGSNYGDPNGISFNANQFGNNSSTMNAQCPQQPGGEQMTDGSWLFNNNWFSSEFN